MKGVPSSSERTKAPAAKIATSVVQVLHAYTGRGQTKAKTTINQGHGDQPARGHAHEGERTLVENGRADQGHLTLATTTSSSCMTTS